jgi:hypothetical protein
MHPSSSAFGGALFLVLGAYLVVGRLIAKRIAKQHTVYVLTNHRALVGRPRTVHSAPLKSATLSIQHSRAGSHLTVRFDTAATRSSFFPQRVPANTGLDFLPGSDADTVAFYDVEDDGSLASAIRRHAV